MSMGILSDTDFEKELEKSKTQIVPMNPLGRGNGSRQVPDSLRRIIGENAIEEGSQGTREMTRAFGISDSSLIAYKAGARSTTTYNDRPNREHLNRAKERIIGKARKTLVASLDQITPEKLAEEKPRDLAGIAKDMSAIIRNLEPDKGEGDKTTNALIIFAPQIINEEKLEVIEVRED